MLILRLGCCDRHFRQTTLVIIATLTILVLEKIPILNNVGFLCQIDACIRGKL